MKSKCSLCDAMVDSARFVEHTQGCVEGVLRKYGAEVLESAVEVCRKRPVAVNDVVQISPEVNHQGGFWSGNYLTVTEVFSWGVQGFCKAGGGQAYIRLKHGQFERIGEAAWRLSAEASEEG